MTESLINSNEVNTTYVPMDDNKYFTNDANNIQMKVLIQCPDANINNNHSSNKSCRNTVCSSLCSCYKTGKVSSEYKGNNMICCNGHIIAGPLSQIPYLLLTLILLLAPLCVYYWLIHSIYYTQLHDIASYTVIMLISLSLSFCCIYFLFKTYLTDPGIIPRESKEHPIFGPLNEFDRFCTTCNVIRSKQAKHCSICNNCINGFDHHCPWVATCVAQRNKCYFVGFVGCTGMLALVVAIVCIANLFVDIYIINILILIYAAIIACILLVKSIDDFIMIGKGITTNERIKYGQRVLTETERERERERKAQNENIFYSNIWMTFCGPVIPSDMFIT